MFSARVLFQEILTLRIQRLHPEDGLYRWLSCSQEGLHILMDTFPNLLLAAPCRCDMTRRSRKLRYRLQVEARIKKEL
jgi:hypothetical protein